MADPYEKQEDRIRRTYLEATAGQFFFQRGGIASAKIDDEYNIQSLAKQLATSKGLNDIRLLDVFQLIMVHFLEIKDHS